MLFCRAPALPISPYAVVQGACAWQPNRPPLTPQPPQALPGSPVLVCMALVQPTQPPSPMISILFPHKRTFVIGSLAGLKQNSFGWRSCSKCCFKKASALESTPSPAQRSKLNSLLGLQAKAGTGALREEGAAAAAAGCIAARLLQCGC